MVAHRTVAEWEAEVGRQVRLLRGRSGLTQAELARNANLSVGTVSNLESAVGAALSPSIGFCTVTASGPVQAMYRDAGDGWGVFESVARVGCLSTTFRAVLAAW